ncbi:MAG: PQQ-binding-like beta-propeller repeat protein [Pirellulales bacterium]|nr:PQQ-binding-like beta-propeller repeat protein [Pirellulales bacterium]
MRRAQPAWLPSTRVSGSAPQTRRRVWFAAAQLLAFVVSTAVAADGADDPFPLADDLAVLASDVDSPAYRELVTQKMLITDLAAEWQRVETSDSAERFAAAHGGRDAVLADPHLNAAYERRQAIEARFLDLMREGYARYKTKPPFDRGATAEPAGSTQLADGAAGPALSIVPPVPDCTAQWPRFRGPTGQGETSTPRVPQRWSESESIRWRAALPGVGNSSPVLWNDHLFVTTAAADGTLRQLHALDRSTGAIRWSQTVPEQTPEQNVRDKNGHASSTPVTDGQRVIALFGTAGLVAYDFAGTLLWQHPLPEFRTTHGCAASPVLYGDTVILIHDQNQAESLFFALDKRDGRLLWQHARPKAMGWCTPVVIRVGDHDELVHASNGKLQGFDPATGEQLWSVDGPTVEVVPACVIGDDLLFCSSGRNGPTLAVRPGGRGDVTKTHLVWRAVRGGPHVPSPLYHAGRLYTVNDTGIVTCFDARTGKPVYQKRIRDTFSASPVLVGELIYLAAESGKTYVLPAGDRFEIVAENELSAPLLASPAVVGDALYLRTPAEVLCIAP